MNSSLESLLSPQTFFIGLRTLYLQGLQRIIFPEIDLKVVSFSETRVVKENIFNGLPLRHQRAPLPPSSTRGTRDKLPGPSPVRSNRGPDSGGARIQC